MRTFIAIKIEPEKKLEEVVKIFREQLRYENISWVSTSNLHLTLRFIGETSKEETVKVSHLFDEAVSHFKSFCFNLEGVGYFKGNNQPRVLFISIVNDHILKHLVHEIEERLLLNGFEKEDKPFRPHLTIGRIKLLNNKNMFYSLVDKHKNTVFQQVKVTEVIYYQSILSASGPTYVPLKKAQLKF